MAAVNGTGNNDILVGTSGADVVTDGAGHDYVVTGGGNDTITGGTGNDWYQSGAGTDTLTLSSGFGLDVIDIFTGAGGTPNNNVQLSGITYESLFGYRTGDHYAFTTYTGSDNATVLDFFSVAPAPFGTFSMPLQAGGTHVDTPSADDDANGIADIRELPRLLFGGEVNDTITATNVGNHQNIVWGGLSNDTLTGSTNSSILFGNGGNDILTSGSSTNYAYLVGGTGNDSYNVASGRLAFVYDLGSSISDTINAPGISTASATLFVETINSRHLFVYEPANSTQIVVLDWTTAASKIELFSLGNGTFTQAQVASLVAGAPNVSWEVWSGGTLTTAEANATLANLQNLSGDDHGPTLNLTMAGGAGNQSLNGFIGNNTLIGGPGNDTMTGRGGNDIYVFRPGDGNDTIFNETDASPGDLDTMRFGAGIRAGQITGSLFSTGLTLTYGTGDSVFLGNWYTNALARQMQIGTSESPVLPLIGPGTAGSAAAEMFFGTAGSDNLSAQGGDDWLVPAAQNDTVDGGTGSDTVALKGARGSYSVTRNGNTVTVTDLNGAGDGGDDGTDTLTNVEFLQFSDRARSLAVQRNDFNGDGAGDLLWRHSSGDLGEWQQDGTSYVGGGVFTGADAGWTLKAMADFNGDGFSDLLWQHSSGLLGLWELNGTTVTGGGVFTGADPGWTLVTASDFSGDGRADILWQHSSGALAEWQMNGTTYIGGGVFSGAAAGWSLKAVADFSGDGRADILWQNAAGDLAQWQMSGTTYIGGGVFTGGAAGWGLKAVADFNGDGKADILWQHSTGDLAEWHMNGTSYIGGGVFTGAAAGWTMLGISDYNADGHADILWQHTSGSLGQWQLNGTSYVGGGVFNGADPGWTPMTQGQLIG